MAFLDLNKRVENDLSIIWPHVSIPRNLFRLYYGDALSRFYHHYPTSFPFPLVDHILRLKSAYIIPETVSVEIRYRIEEQWVFGLFILGLSRSIKSFDNFRDARNWLTIILDEKSLRWIGSDVGLPLVECIAGNYGKNTRIKSLILQSEMFTNPNNDVEQNDLLLEQLEKAICDLHSEGKLAYNRASSLIFSLTEGFFIYKMFFRDISVLTNRGNISNEALINHLLVSESESFCLKQYLLNKGAKKAIKKGYFFKSKLPTNLGLEISQDFSELNEGLTQDSEKIVR